MQSCLWHLASWTASTLWYWAVDLLLSASGLRWAPVLLNSVNVCLKNRQITKTIYCNLFISELQEHRRFSSDAIILMCENLMIRTETTWEWLACLGFINRYNLGTLNGYIELKTCIEFYLLQRRIFLLLLPSGAIA